MFNNKKYKEIICKCCCQLNKEAEATIFIKIFVPRIVIVLCFLFSEIITSRPEHIP